MDLVKKYVLEFLSLIAFVTAFASPNMSGSKVVLVTGGNKGIGQAICRKLLTDYPDVFVLLGARDQGRGERAVSELASSVPNGKDRISLVQIDTSSDESVHSAASSVGQLLKDQGTSLYGIVNNAGIGWGHTYEETMGTNYFGPRRVNDAFAAFLTRPGGRIVNISSAAGPTFVSRSRDGELRKLLAEPLTATIEQVDSIAKIYKGKADPEDLYGFSKALLNAYTVLYATECPDLIINSCTPGYIKTDLAPGGTGSTEKGSICPIYLLMAKEMENTPTGRYYGSDTKRSPIDRYRGPGDPPYEGP